MPVILYLLIGALAIGCANPVPQDRPDIGRCPQPSTSVCPAPAQLPGCSEQQTLDEWVEQMDRAENGNTDQPM